MGAAVLMMFVVVFGLEARKPSGDVRVKLVDHGSVSGKWQVQVSSARIEPWGVEPNHGTSDVFNTGRALDGGVVAFAVPRPINPLGNAVSFFVTSDICQGVHSFVVPAARLPATLTIEVHGTCVPFPKAQFRLPDGGVAK